MLDPSFTLYSSTTYKYNRPFNNGYMLGGLLNEMCKAEECLKNVTCYDIETWIHILGTLHC